MTDQESSKPAQKPKPRFRWKVLIIPPLLVCGGYLALLYFTQHSIIFPTEFVDGDPEAFPRQADAERLVLEQKSQKVPAYYFPSKDADTCILIAHGNAELAQNWFDQAEDLVAGGFSVLIVEYPGYGKADGSPSQKSIARFMDTGYDHLLRIGYKPDKLVGLGSSVGAGVICDLSTRKKLAALVLISPFRSLKEMAWKHYAPPFLVRSPFDNEAALRQFQGPVLIFHGKDDEIIPFGHSEHLASLDESFTLIPLVSGHNDIHLFWQREMIGRISGFFREAIK